MAENPTGESAADYDGTKLPERVKRSIREQQDSGEQGYRPVGPQQLLQVSRIAGLSDLIDIIAITGRFEPSP